MSTRSIITLVAACWALVILGVLLDQLYAGRFGLAVALITACVIFYACGVSNGRAMPTQPPTNENSRRVEVKGTRLDRIA